MVQWRPYEWPNLFVQLNEMARRLSTLEDDFWDTLVPEVQKVIPDAFLPDEIDGGSLPGGAADSGRVMPIDGGDLSRGTSEGPLDTSDVRKRGVPGLAVVKIVTSTKGGRIEGEVVIDGGYNTDVGRRIPNIKYAVEQPSVGDYGLVLSLPDGTWAFIPIANAASTTNETSTSGNCGGCGNQPCTLYVDWDCADCFNGSDTGIIKLAWDSTDSKWLVDTGYSDHPACIESGTELYYNAGGPEFVLYIKGPGTDYVKYTLSVADNCDNVAQSYSKDSESCTSGSAPSSATVSETDPSCPDCATECPDDPVLSLSAPSGSCCCIGDVDGCAGYTSNNITLTRGSGCSWTGSYSDGMGTATAQLQCLDILCPDCWDLKIYDGGHGCLDTMWQDTSPSITCSGGGAPTGSGTLEGQNSGSNSPPCSCDTQGCTMDYTLT